MTLQDAYTQIREHLANRNHSDFRVDLYVTTGITDTFAGDVGLTWEPGTPHCHRTVNFAVDTSFHNDVDIRISLERYTDLDGEVVAPDWRYVSQGDAHNCGAADFPDLVELFFQLAENLL